MNLNDWKVRLKPAGALLLLYLFAPVLVRWFMGGADSIRGGLTFSGLVQAGLGIAFIRGLFSLKPELNSELAARLEKYAQPREKTLEFAEKISLAAGFIAVLAIVWPPVGEMLAGGRLTTLVKTAALVYAVYLGYTLWKLAEPFLAAAPAARPPEDPEEPAPPPAAARRCPKCGQLLTDSAASCSFCKHSL